MPGGIFSGPDLPSPPPPPPPVTEESPEAEEARRREIIAAQKTRGRAATLLTSGSGVPGKPKTQSASALLLGE